MRKGFCTAVMLFCGVIAPTCFAQTADSKTLASYSGSYSLGRNEFIWFVVDGGSLIFGESVSGRGGRLVQVAEKKFVAGPALGVDSPVTITAEFVANTRGEIESLKWEHGAERVARKVKLTEEEVKFQNGNVTLAGTLYLPPAKGPHPAMVFVTGSGPALRDQFGGFPQMFASLGVATLVYDKRGCGASTGSFYDSLPETPAAGNLRWVEQERKTLFDPQSYWARIQVPVLLVNGGLDRNVPGKESAAQIEQLLKKGGNKNVTVKLFPDADHQLWKVSKLGQRDGRSNQVGVYQEMITFLLTHTKIAKK